MNCAEESGILSHRGEVSSVTKQALPVHGSPLAVSQSREREGFPLDLNEKSSPSNKHVTTQPSAPFMMNNCIFPSATISPQQLQYLLAQQGQVAYGMPPHLGGTLYLAPPGQVPCVMPTQEGTNFASVQQQIQPLQTLREGEVPVPSGPPKEVEFPRSFTQEPPARPRERWEIKPRRPRPPTDAERQRAMDEAYEFWTPNPHVMVALKPSQVYAGFSLVNINLTFSVWDYRGVYINDMVMGF